MDRKFVFCGCQYPSRADKASGWEWDIPTPNRRKRRPISWSQPSLPQQRSEMEFNKRYSDNVYEAVNPLEPYSSGLIGGDPETSSLDRHPFYIPPELDIVSSEGLDGLDQPDPHDFGMDGDKEWSLFDVEKAPAPPPKSLFIAGIRKEAPKIGETSRMRPLKQERPVTPEAPKKINYEESPPLEIETEDEEMQIEEPITAQELPETKAEKTDKGKLDVKARLEKITDAVRPKLRKLASFKLLRKKGGKENVAPGDEEVEGAGAEPEPAPGPSRGRFEVRQVKIRFDDTLDLSLQDPARPKAPESAEELVEPQSQLEMEVQKEIEKQEMQRLKSEEKAEQDRIREEAKKLKAEAEADAKRIKAEEKEAKDKEMAEQKRLKAEEKLAKQQQEAEQKKQQAEAKKAEAEAKKAEAEAKKQEQEELKKQEAETKKQKQEELKRKKAEAEEAAKLEKELQKELAEEAAKMAKEFQRQSEEAADLQREKEAAEKEQWKAEQQIQKEEEAAKFKLQTEQEFLGEQEFLKEIAKNQEYEEVCASKTQAEVPIEQKQKKEKPKRGKIGILKSARPKQKNDTEEMEAEAMEQIFPEESKSLAKSKTPSKVEVLKRKLGDINFKRRFKRQSKTPPPRPSPPRFKITPLGEQELALQYRQEMIERLESESTPTQSRKARLPEPQIYVTQPSVETESEATHVQWEPSSTTHTAEELEDEIEPKAEKKPIGEKLRGFGEKSRSMAERTSQRVKSKVNVIGSDLKKFGGKMNTKYQEAVKDIRAREEARRLAQEEKERRSESQSESVPTTPAGNVFRFKRKPRKQQGEDDSAHVPTTPVIVAAERKVRGKKDPQNYENSELENPNTSRDENVNLDRSALLGRASRDYWESAEKYDSREASEEPNFSAHAHSSGWESPPDSSNASSSRGQSRSKGQVGVLEEIDSDEFFLREKGISEGEDEAEMTRFLVSELREAFRPTHVSVLSSFTPPSRPRRHKNKSPIPAKSDSPKKPGSPNFQTFPPERPKRKHKPGYISAYVESLDHEISEDEEEAMESHEQLFAFEPNSESEEDEGIRRVKAQLRKIEDDDRYEPVNRTESGDKPSRPNRTKKQPKRKSPPQKLYYNTIAANEWADDDDLELQILATELKQQKNGVAELDTSPVRPKRNSKKSLEGSRNSMSPKLCQRPDSASPKIGEAVINGSPPGRNWATEGYLAETEIADLNTAEYKPWINQLAADNDIHSNDFEPVVIDAALKLNQSELGSEILDPQRTKRLEAFFDDESLTFADETEDKQDTLTAPPRNLALAETESLLFEDVQDDDDLDGDASGYALVKSAVPPATVPRRKRKSQSKGASLKRKSRELPTPPTVPSCALPRFTPRTFHIVPPSRPHRTYSAIRPKRPPRKKGKEQPQEDPPPPRREPEKTGPRPSASIMRDRPLPPPPRPPRPAIFMMNDLDQEALERSLGASHYANWVNDPETAGVMDAANGDVMRRVEVVEQLCTARNISLLGGEEDLNVAVQTDPLTEEEFEYNDLNSSFEEDERFQKLTDSIHKLPSDDKIAIDDESRVDQTEDPAEIVDNFITPDLERRISNHAQNATQIIFPTRLHLDELEVDFLRVNELSAQTLTLDHLQTSHLGVESMKCSGALSVGAVRLDTGRPARVNDELTSSSDRLTSDQHPFPSEPPASFYELRSPRTDSESDPTLETLPPRQRSLTSSPPHEGDRSANSEPEDEVIDLGMRLGRSILRSGLRAIQNFMETLEHVLPPDSEGEEKQRIYLQLMLCVLLLLITGILLFTRSTTQQHHWDFYLPPNDLI